MNTLVKNHVERIEQTQKAECWYIVKQDVVFWKQCYYTMVLLEYISKNQESSVSSNVEEYFKNRINELNSQNPNLGLSTTHRALRVSYVYGLITDDDSNYSNYSNAKATEVYKSIYKRTNGDFEKVELYQDIILWQLEKIFISSNLDEQSKGVREQFKIYPVIFLYKILLEIGISTGSYSITMDEYRYFVSVQTQFNNYLDTLTLIKESRENEELYNQFKTYRDVLDNRFNLVLEQLSTLEIRGNIINIKMDMMEHIKEKINNYDVYYDEYEKCYKDFLCSINNDSTHETNNIKEDIVCKNLDYTIQDLFFGAPGTGKSFLVKKIVNSVYNGIDEKDNPYVYKTTIHPDYSYFDFIGTVMPTSNDGEIKYDFVPGIFTQALLAANKNKDKEIFLVVEEMSRGNVAGIFGDIFQLLDRDENGISEYSISNDLIQSYLDKNGINTGKIFLPRNLHILGTVNTSDQNVNVIDTAFKRRFGYVYSKVDPIARESGNYYNEYRFTLGDVEYEWNKLYMTLNAFITKELELSEDKQIGQFFLKLDNINGEDANNRKFNEIKNKLLHYLWDDVQKVAINNEFSIFKDKYKTFSKLYEGFESKENIFSEEFIKLYNTTGD